MNGTRKRTLTQTAQDTAAVQKKKSKSNTDTNHFTSTQNGIQVHIKPYC